MRVHVNGEERELDAEATVADLLEEMPQPAVQLAVAVNGEVVQRQRWEHAPLRDGDRVEIVTAIQGG